MGMEAINAANRTLEEELGITVSYFELPNEAVVEARLPNGQTRREVETGYLTATVCLRMTENLLSTLKVRDLERAKPKALYGMRDYIPPPWVIDSLERKPEDRPGLYLPVPDRYEPEDRPREEKPESTGGTVIVIQL
jgi:hypothetical protein